jgi:hypothetical protein
MCSCLHGDETPRYPFKCLLHRFRCRRHFLFQNDFACFVQNTVERPAIAEVHTNREPRNCWTKRKRRGTRSLLMQSICGNAERASRMRFPIRVIAKNLNTTGTCKRVQIFVLVALILYPQSVRQVVQEYRSERSERRRWKI